MREREERNQKRELGKNKTTEKVDGGRYWERERDRESR